MSKAIKLMAPGKQWVTLQHYKVYRPCRDWITVAELHLTISGVRHVVEWPIAADGTLPSDTERVMAEAFGDTTPADWAEVLAAHPGINIADVINELPRALAFCVALTDHEVNGLWR